MNQTLMMVMTLTLAHFLNKVKSLLTMLATLMPEKQGSVHLAKTKEKYC